ncbi:MAG: hypothetical protein ACK5MM_01125 [Planctomyces sp.]
MGILLAAGLTRRREEKYTRSVIGCRSSGEPRTEVCGWEFCWLLASREDAKTRRREDAKKNTQGQSSVVGRQASRGRKHTGVNHSKPSRGRIPR